MSMKDRVVIKACDTNLLSRRENSIIIHPPGSRTTDIDRAESIARFHPKSFRKAQDLLVATEKYVNRTGFLSTEKTRYGKVKKECHSLYNLLRSEGHYKNEKSFFLGKVSKDNKIKGLFSFLSDMSDAFPNWQDEYETLNRIIPKLF